MKSRDSNVLWLQITERPFFVGATLITTGLVCKVCALPFCLFEVWTPWCVKKELAWFSSCHQNAAYCSVAFPAVVWTLLIQCSGQGNFTGICQQSLIRGVWSNVKWQTTDACVGHKSRCTLTARRSSCSSRESHIWSSLIFRRPRCLLCLSPTTLCNILCFSES